MTRTHAPSRLEGFSDTVFGFALTLLVVQLESPRSVEQLSQLVRGSVPFALTFAMVCWIWWEHNKFFRRYGLQDAWVTFLNAALLFVVLFYVYPLKFLTTTLLAPLVGLEHGGGLSEGRFVLVVYSTGLAMIFGVFLLLYRYAWAMRAQLELDAAERVRLRFGARGHGMSFGLAITSIALALVVPDPWMWVPGVLYVLMGPLHAYNGFGVARALAALTPAAGAAPPDGGLASAD